MCGKRRKQSKISTGRRVDQLANWSSSFLYFRINSEIWQGSKSKMYVEVCSLLYDYKEFWGNATRRVVYVNADVTASTATLSGVCTREYQNNKLTGQNTTQETTQSVHTSPSPTGTKGAGSRHSGTVKLRWGMPGYATLYGISTGTRVCVTQCDSVRMLIDKF